MWKAFTTYGESTDKFLQQHKAVLYDKNRSCTAILPDKYQLTENIITLPLFYTHMARMKGGGVK